MQQPKKITCFAFLRLLFLLLPVIFFMTSCNNDSGGVVIQVPNDTSALGKINHFIPLAQIKAYEAAFASERDSLLKFRPGFSIPLSEAFNKQSIIELLQIPDCVGIRILYGIKKNGDSSSVRLVLVGVNSKGENLYLSEQKPGRTTNETATADSAGRQMKTAESSDEEVGGEEHGQCNPPCPNNY
ncbi:hypothetical protein [Ferruginibacter sp.]